MAVDLLPLRALAVHLSRVGRLAPATMKMVLLTMIVIENGSIRNRDAKTRTMTCKMLNPTTEPVVQESRANHLTEVIVKRIGIRAVRSIIRHAHDVAKMIVGMLLMLWMTMALQLRREERIESTVPANQVDMSHRESGTATVIGIVDEKSAIVTESDLGMIERRTTHRWTKTNAVAPESTKHIMKVMVAARIVPQKL